MLMAECLHPANLKTATLILRIRIPTQGPSDPMAKAIQNETQYIDAFLKLTLKPTAAPDLFPLLTSLTPGQRQEFTELADANHVVIRVFEVLNRVAGNRGDGQIQAWAVETLAKERARITNALSHLETVCNVLEEE